MYLLMGRAPLSSHVSGGLLARAQFLLWSFCAQVAGSPGCPRPSCKRDAGRCIPVISQNPTQVGVCATHIL